MSKEGFLKWMQKEEQCNALFLTVTIVLIASLLFPSGGWIQVILAYTGFAGVGAHLYEALTGSRVLNKWVAKKWTALLG